MTEHVGGQALIEGVMMRKGKNIATAIINDDKIKVKEFKIRPLTDRNRLFGMPFIRGIFALIDMTYIGMKELIYSANESGDEPEEKLKPLEVVFSISFAVVFAILLFKLLPLGITKLISNSDLIGESRVVFNLIDGLLRIFIFVMYVFIISLLPDIKRVFEYHGAEHKAVNCFEDGKKLTLENVRRYTTIHTRCGTSFLFIVLLFAIIIFSVVPIDLPFVFLFFYRLPLIFPIAGVSYEMLKLGAKFENSAFFRMFSWPGLMVQKITTREPDDRQIEVAIAALKPLV